MSSLVFQEKKHFQGFVDFISLSLMLHSYSLLLTYIHQFPDYCRTTMVSSKLKTKAPETSLLQISSLWSSNQKPLETSPPPLELRHLTSISAAAHVPGAAALKLPSKPCKLERPSSLSPFSLSLLFSFLSSRLKERLQFSNHRNFSVFETRGKLWIFSHAQKTSKPKAWALNSTTNPTF